MADIIHTSKRDYKYNGPVDSADYNLRIEENYKDLVYLYNKASLIDSKLAKTFERVLKDHVSISAAIADLESRIAALEASSRRVSISSYSQLDYSSFVGTSFAIPSTQLLSFDPTYNVITLPRVSSSSYSRLKFSDPTYGQVIPSYFKSFIDNSFNGIDSPGAIVETTPVYNAVLDSMDKVWNRTIVSPTSSAYGAQMMLYVLIPTQASSSSKSNYLQLNPFPSFGADISLIEYTTKVNPSLNNSDGWTPLNSEALYDSETDAIGKVAPGGWYVSGSDSIENAGPLKFVFAEKDITAIRIKFKKRDYFSENSQHIYSYGLSDLDVGFNKYLQSGKTIIKFTPSNGDFINEVVSVTPKIYNVPRSLLSSIFSYRIIYESGGVYGVTNPGSSASVWVEVTLNMLDDTTPPVLSDLVIEYN